MERSNDGSKIRNPIPFEIAGRAHIVLAIRAAQCTYLLDECTQANGRLDRIQKFNTFHLFSQSVLCIVC